MCEHACVADCILTVGDVYFVGLNILTCHAEVIHACVHFLTWYHFDLIKN